MSNVGNVKLLIKKFNTLSSINITSAEHPVSELRRNILADRNEEIEQRRIAHNESIRDDMHERRMSSSHILRMSRLQENTSHTPSQAEGIFPNERVMENMHQLKIDPTENRNNDRNNVQYSNPNLDISAPSRHLVDIVKGAQETPKDLEAKSSGENLVKKLQANRSQEKLPITKSIKRENAILSDELFNARASKLLEKKKLPITQENTPIDEIFLHDVQTIPTPCHVWSKPCHVKSCKIHVKPIHSTYYPIHSKSRSKDFKEAKSRREDFARKPEASRMQEKTPITPENTLSPNTRSLKFSEYKDVRIFYKDDRCIKDIRIIDSLNILDIVYIKDIRCIKDIIDDFENGIYDKPGNFLLPGTPKSEAPKSQNLCIKNNPALPTVRLTPLPVGYHLHHVLLFIEACTYNKIDHAKKLIELHPQIVVEAMRVCTKTMTIRNQGDWNKGKIWNFSESNDNLESTLLQLVVRHGNLEFVKLLVRSTPLEALNELIEQDNCIPSFWKRITEPALFTAIKMGTTIWPNTKDALIPFWIVRYLVESSTHLNADNLERCEHLSEYLRKINRKVYKKFISESFQETDCSQLIRAYLIMTIDDIVIKTEKGRNKRKKRKEKRDKNYELLNDEILNDESFNARANELLRNQFNKGTS